MDPEIATILESKEKNKKDTIVVKPEIHPEFCRGASIQIFYSKNRLEAEETIKDFNTKFPTMKSKLFYVSPDFRVKTGIFKSREEATEDLKKIKKKFPLALISEETFRCSQFK